MIILLLHTPYIFFNLKENVFVIYDEYLGKLSAQIEAKLVKFYNKKDSSTIIRTNKDLLEEDALASTARLISQPRGRTTL